MARYFVDLSPYSDEEFERLHDILQGFSFLCLVCPEKNFRTFDVIWNNKTSIENLLQIPSNLVTFVSL